MKRIYKNNDLVFNLTINNFPINKDLINSIEFKFYTLNQSNYILKTQDDIDVYNQVVLEWSELRKLEEGVLFYDYNLSLKNEEMNDGTEDTVNKIMTNYYIVTGNETIDINSDMANYYTKDEIDDLIANIEGGEVDLTKYYTKSQIDIKLNGYVEDDVLGSYYTKNEVNDLIDGLSTSDGEINLTNYYTKGEVDTKLTSYSTSGHTHSQYLTEHQSLSGYAKLTDIPTDYVTESKLNAKGYLTAVPSEYVTETELERKGYLTEHQPLTNYYTKNEVNNLIDGLSTGDGEVNLTNYYTKSEVDAKIPTDYITSIPSEYVTESELNEKGYLTEHQSLSGYAKLTDIPTDYAKDNHTHTEYLTEHQSLENYYTKTEVDNKFDNIEIPTGSTNVDLSDYYTKDEIDERIPTDYIKAVNIGKNEDENFQVEDGVVNIYTEFYNGSYDMNIDSRSVFGLKPIDDTITLESAGGTGNDNFRCGIKINDNVINRISALESELTGVSEQITELNNMVV